MARPLDLRSQRFGKLVAIEPTNKRKYGKVVWSCKCDCGNLHEVVSSELTRGHTKSCGCQKGKDNAIDLRGQRFGKLVALKPTKKRSTSGEVVWECECECGAKTMVSTSNLGHNKTQSCGCSRIIDIEGQRFGRLVALKMVGLDNNFKAVWLCKCDCSNKTEVTSNCLMEGNTRSCGCLKKEVFSGSNNPNYNHNLTDEEREFGRNITENGLNKTTWSQQVMQRDNYTCSVCGKYNGNHVAHHLDGWNWAKDKRFDLDNGVTLCESCHKEFHTNYGYGNNTKEQYEQFKEGFK